MTLVDFGTNEEFCSAASYQRQFGVYPAAAEKALPAAVSAVLGEL